ncbi:hypothetical protein CEXT_79391 [Caerostris extrusa]|uniref:Uncharacterized protein n=1 Tax=Caerostris extrusa TaxID=172846 RepID=A0AAV4MKP7_CAEEX|nr:hypothetical protein CEXT_79391 [Caerostris extrusa]
MRRNRLAAWNESATRHVFIGQQRVFKNKNRHVLISSYRTDLRMDFGTFSPPPPSIVAAGSVSGGLAPTVSAGSKRVLDTSGGFIWDFVSD